MDHNLYGVILQFLDHARLMVEADNECDLPCGKKLWDGYGRWIGYGQWKPFMEEINLPSSSGRYLGISMEPTNAVARILQNYDL